MTYYNVYRPHGFSSILGQGQVTGVLQKQVANHSFSHSYLFHGPSGTGKTTTARVLAMAMCCDTMNGTGEPCGRCQSCQNIINACHWDVLEIDSARFRGIDDMKELAYRAYLTPLGARKVYILDECHQLTAPAFAAMLKLLEEPPPHLYIILATTEVNQLPETIVSRCQVFKFNKLGPADIVKKLESISASQGVTVSLEHLNFIAESSAGNMRSAENLLEQCLCLAK